MKSTTLNEHAFLLIFDRGDEIAATLTSFAAEHAIQSASFTAIGACERAVIAYWNRETKEYEKIDVAEQVEVVSLIGNLARGENNEPRLHAHVSLGKRDGSLIGGHFVSGIVYPTLELFLTTSSVALKRKRDEETGLQLLK